MANRLKKNPVDKSSPHTAKQQETVAPIPPFKKEKKDPPFSELYARRRKWKILGIFILFVAVVWTLSIVSFLFSWKDDFDKIQQDSFSFLFDNNIAVDNIMGRIGLWIAYRTVYLGFGLPTLILCYLSANWGASLFFKNFKRIRIARISFYTLCMLYLSVSLAFILSHSGDFPYGGYIGLSLSELLGNFMGSAGLSIFLAICLLSYAVWFGKFSINYASLVSKLRDILPPFLKRSHKENEESSEHISPPENDAEEEAKIQASPEEEPNIKGNTIKEGYQFKSLDINEENPIDDSIKHTEHIVNDRLVEEKLKELEEDELPAEPSAKETGKIEPSVRQALPIEKAATEERVADEESKVAFEVSIAPNLANADGAETIAAEQAPLVENDLVYKTPPISLLKKYESNEINIDENELESNKKQIIHTLRNFKINIQKISATIGPTVTLYEIIPEEGTRISKIKNLEDDIALSLSALGIRIIAPMPGKGTIGIEVPNQRKRIVGLRTLLSSSAFAHSAHILPVAFGKTIANEDFIVDLSKMPHLLMAGATGQGKSVGLNALLVSLLYKKHPSDLKLVLVDPKKVELTLFSKIEKHFLAKLPGEEEAIITDTKKVIHALNALCIEMDNRYDLLKDAYCRNIEEYNDRFKRGKLSENKGHQYLPYIVVVIDEFADLIMTAGKEIEIPIARLAQLARAIGIHLVIATQRPSVNIITGMIKANFPSRIAFKVSSRIDSRTILDEGGADQLIGKGDMLISQSGGLARLQCAFVDTEEVENICAFIAKQPIIEDPYILPQYEEAEEKGVSSIRAEEKDALFEEVAYLVVTHQSGSTSFIQRKMKLGFNRAGRLMDQLEMAGIVSATKGAKPRDVLIKTETELSLLLSNL